MDNFLNSLIGPKSQPKRSKTFWSIGPLAVIL